MEQGIVVVEWERETGGEGEKDAKNYDITRQRAEDIEKDRR